MVTKPTEKVWWICSSVQAGPSGPASALSKTQARVGVRAAALPLETIWSSCCRSSAARVMTYFLFMAEVPVRKDRFPPLYGSLPTFQYNLDKALATDTHSRTRMQPQGKRPRRRRRWLMRLTDLLFLSIITLFVSIQP